MWQLVKDIVSGAAALLRFREKKLDLDNSPAMQANARAKADQQIKDAATKAVAANDLDEMRRQAAE
jgi:hypothetical protein